MKLGKIAKQVLGTVAPLVGTAIGGPFGGIAGKVLSTALGTDDPKDIDKRIVAGDPETMAAIKKAEQQFDATMRELDIQEQDLYLKDVADARALAKDTGIWPQFTIVSALTLMVAGVIWALFTVDVTKVQNDILYFLLGNLTTAWLSAIAFFVGTTKSSQEKTKQLGAR